MSSSNSLSYPFRRLPNELKAEIFRLDSLVASRNMRTRAMKLGAVCRQWREIVWSMPELWVSIDVNCDIFHYSYEVFDIYIKNSKNHPLDISITFGHRDREQEQGSKVSSDLVHQAHRRKVLEISFGELLHWIDDCNEIAINVENLLKGPLPLLETAILDGEESINPKDISSVFDMDKVFRKSPLLRELSITVLDHSPLAFACCPQVTKLSLDCVSVPFCIDAITFLPNLTHGIFRYMTYPEDEAFLVGFRFNDDSSIFVHKSLKSLEIITEADDIDTLFLRSISCPSLEKFSIDSESENEQHMLQVTADFLRVSNCSLTELQVRMSRLSSPILPLFDQVHTTIEAMELETSYHSSDLIQVFMVELSSPSYFPQLTRLNIFEPRGPLDYTIIYSHLKKRIDSSSSQPLLPLIVKFVLEEEGCGATMDSHERSCSVSDDSDDNDVDKFVKLKESGIDVSFYVHPRRHRPML